MVLIRLPMVAYRKVAVCCFRGRLAVARGIVRRGQCEVSGATGTGKTLTVAQYVKAAIQAGERALLFGAEQSRGQLTRNATLCGVDFEQSEKMKCPLSFVVNRK